MSYSLLAADGNPAPTPRESSGISMAPSNTRDAPSRRHRIMTTIVRVVCAALFTTTLVLIIYAACTRFELPYHASGPAPPTCSRELCGDGGNQSAAQSTPCRYDGDCKVGGGKDFCNIDCEAWLSYAVPAVPRCPCKHKPSDLLPEPCCSSRLPDSCPARRPRVTSRCLHRLEVLHGGVLVAQLCALRPRVPTPVDPRQAQSPGHRHPLLP